MFEQKVNGIELDIFLTNYCKRKDLKKKRFIRETIDVNPSTHYKIRDRDTFLNERIYKKYRKALPGFDWDE